ncbi:efflux RND transporter periplasmic adaptor subunit [Maribacter dokdonensis]|uniref:efflux RND transporter periplasmic adaptor subunit n=1 Tax=Maribacter dokdonensis TaxID=320912 RepID=UPI0007198D6B|nr:efflux RND transporter periplasmic adaptor subunit [Maribacter dokdonensis]KSA12602.1 putative Co/Zn/Cd efflux system membrane fusion protein [Maribacter dokdonensis DSW-8]CAG2531658.1 MFP subunit [Maribacter dokdonensis]
MKKLPILLIAVIGLYSCGGEDQSVAEIISGQNLEAIRAKKNEITTQQKLIDAQLKSLDSAIAILGNEEKLPLVNTLTAKKEIFNHYLELQGDVSTKQNVLIYPEMAGTLQRVYVKEGDRVSKGQVLATIDDGGMSSQLNQLKTQASLAKTTFERQERLWNQNIGSEIQYLQAKTNYEAAENMVSQAQSQLGKSTIRAPFSGIIDNVIKDQGTVVAPGQGSEVFRIVNLSDMYIEVEVPEAYLGNVTKGKEALVYFPILGDSVVTKIRETGNFINPSNRSFEAEIPVPNKEGKIKPNLSAKVNINDYTSEDAILIPTSIISENAEGEQYVFVADEPNADGESVVKRTIITTGKTQGAAIEVLTGLNDGDHIIKEGARSVKDGQKVKIKK